jgi:membrane-associated phospholipid phosphatase
LAADGPAPLFVTNPRRSLAVAGGLLAMVVIGAFVIPAGPLRIDARWAGWVGDVQRAWLRHLATAYRDAGRGALSVGIPVAIGIVLAVLRRFVALLAFAVTEVLTPLLDSLIKQIVDRPRPPGAALLESSSSFPSGHAAYATGIVVSLVLIAPRRHRPAWIAIAALVAAGMAWSRTNLQVHWLSDVVAGTALGAGVALAVFAVTQLAVERRRNPSRPTTP